MSIKYFRKRGIFGSPDLMVEVLSKGNKKTDRMVKFKLYAQFKVPQYWMVDPIEKTMEESASALNANAATSPQPANSQAIKAKEGEEINGIGSAIYWGAL